MSTSSTSTSLIPQTALFLASNLSGSFPACISTTLEGAFYSSLKSNTADSFQNNVSDFCISFIHQIQFGFIALNAGIIWYLAFQIFQDHYTSIGLGAGVCLASWGIHAWQDQCAQPQEKKTIDNVGIQEATTFAQDVTKSVHLAKLILYGLAIVSGKNVFSSSITLVGSLHNYYKNHQLKWIQFTQKSNIRYKDKIPMEGFTSPTIEREATVSYKMLNLAPTSSLTQKTCSICHEVKSPVDMGFCSRHAFHKDCLEKYVIHSSENFLKDASLRKTHVVETGRTYREYDKFHAVIPQKNLPRCPNCRTFPEQNFIEVFLPGCSSSTSLTRIQNRSKPLLPLFETLYSAYNMARAGLSSLQQYSELTALVFKVECVFFLTDIAGYGITLYYLHHKIQEFLKISEEQESMYHTAFAAVALALAAFSYGISFKLRKLLDASSPALKGLAHSNLKWGTPFIFTAMHCLAMNRIIATLALSFFSKNFWANRLSLISQIFSFYHFSKLRWIESTELFEYSNKKTSLSPKQLTIRSFFLVPGSCIKDPSHLKSIVSAIQEYGQKVLNNSILKIFYVSEFPAISGFVKDLNNIKKLIYGLNIGTSHSLNCICSTPIVLTNQVISAINDKVKTVSAKIFNYSGLLWECLGVFPNNIS